MEHPGAGRQCSQAVGGVGHCQAATLFGYTGCTGNMGNPAAPGCKTTGVYVVRPAAAATDQPQGGERRGVHH